MGDPVTTADIFMEAYKKIMESSVHFQAPVSASQYLPPQAQPGSAYNAGALARQGGASGSYNPAAVYQYLYGRAPQQYVPAGPPTGHLKAQIEEVIMATKVTKVTKVYTKLWGRVPFIDIKHAVMGCCVCKTKTAANMPWYRPFRIMKVVGLLKKEFPYKDLYSTSRYEGKTISYDTRDYFFAVCSEECENFMYVNLLDL